MKPFNTLILISCVGFFNLATAQMSPQFSHYMFVNPHFNPGATGIANTTDLALIYRYQWLGNRPTNGDISGSPQSALLNANTKIHILNSGVGGVILQDQVGPWTTLNAKFNYSYHFNVGEGRLGVGVGAGLLYTGINTAVLSPNQANDPRIDFLTANNNATTFDINAGIFYAAKNYFVGISSTHINQPSYLGRVAMYDASVYNRLYYVTGGYNFQINDLFSLSPSVLLKSQFLSFNTTSMDISALVHYNNSRFWGGLAFRTGDALTALVGVGLLKDHRMRVGYGFDLTLLGSAAKAGTSHEIMLTYTKPVADLLPKPLIRTPRYRF